MLRLLACAAALALVSAGPKQKQQQEQVEALKKGMAGVAQTNQKEAIAKGMKGAKDAAKVAAAMCGEKPCQIGHTPGQYPDKLGSVRFAQQQQQQQQQHHVMPRVPHPSVAQDLWGHSFHSLPHSSPHYLAQAVYAPHETHRFVQVHQQAHAQQHAQMQQHMYMQAQQQAQMQQHAYMQAQQQAHMHAQAHRGPGGSLSDVYGLGAPYGRMYQDANTPFQGSFSGHYGPMGFQDPTHGGMGSLPSSMDPRGFGAQSPDRNPNWSFGSGPIFGVAGGRQNPNYKPGPGR